ncbi:MAG TPA: tetratricopeptide repeat protein, partial [Gemmata sp.]|nr:tetratricopeptide repeat protein [Gemmata sp.]
SPGSIAIADFTTAIAIDPGDPAPVFNRGLAHIRLKNMPAAIADFTESIRLAPDDSAAFVQRGFAFLESRDTARALADFTEAIRLKPEGSRAYFARALAQRRVGDFPAAIADASAAIERNPKSDAAFNLRGALHYRTRNYIASLSDHEAAKELDPDDPATLNHLAWLRAACPQEEVRNGAEAIRYATQACELTDFAVPGYVDTLAAAYAEAGRFEDAVRWQEKAVNLVTEEYREDYQSRLELYRGEKPYRDEAVDSASSRDEPGA